jgi:signal transduction histidine kinase
VRVLEDRARIARDLHDHVIQQLFAAGLAVQAAVPRIADERTAMSLQNVVSNLDEAIKRIRTSIFQARSSRARTLRAAVLDIVEEVRPGLGFEPAVDLDGPIDTMIRGDLAEDVIAFVREGLTNVAKHARAQRAHLALHATTTSLTVTVSDDGAGIGPTKRRSGLDNLRERAESRHGSMLVGKGAGLGGTTLVWTVPIETSRIS